MQRWFSSSALGMTENTSSKNNTQRNNSQQNVVKRRSKPSPPRLPYHKLFTYRPEFVWKQKGTCLMKPIKSSQMLPLSVILGLIVFTDIITRLNGKPRSAALFTIWAIVSLTLLYPRWVVYYITPEGFKENIWDCFLWKTYLGRKSEMSRESLEKVLLFCLFQRYMSAIRCRISRQKRLRNGW